MLEVFDDESSSRRAVIISEEVKTKQRDHSCLAFVLLQLSCLCTGGTFNHSAETSSRGLTLSPIFKNKFDSWQESAVRGKSRQTLNVSVEQTHHVTVRLEDDSAAPQ